MNSSFRLGAAALVFGGLLALPSAALAAGAATSAGTAPAGQHRQLNGWAGMRLQATGAQGQHGGGTGRGAGQVQHHARVGSGVGRGVGGDLQVEATALKLTPQQLRQQLQSGKSIAQIAQAQGVALQTVKDAIVAAVRSRLDQQVAAGRLTSAQESQRLSTLQSNLDQRLNATGGRSRRTGTAGRPRASATPAPATSGS